MNLSEIGFSDKKVVKVGAQKFLTKKGIFSPMGTLKRKKTPFFGDFRYFVGSQGARKWHKFLPKTFFIDFDPKRTFLPNFTFLSFLTKQLEPGQKKRICGTLWGPMGRGNGRNFCQIIFSSTSTPNAHFCQISLFYHF